MPCTEGRLARFLKWRINRPSSVTANVIAIRNWLSRQMAMLSQDDRDELDFDKIGPVLESLVNSDRVTDVERRAIELCARAAIDFMHAEHGELMDSFYARHDIQQHIGESKADWLDRHPNAQAGEMAFIVTDWHVSTHGPDGKLQLTKVADAWWPEDIDDQR